MCTEEFSVRSEKTMFSNGTGNSGASNVALRREEVAQRKKVCVSNFWKEPVRWKKVNVSGMTDRGKGE